jgi:hypothetical protein
MRSVRFAPDVAELLGATQIARLASDAWDETVQCWDCGQPVLPGDPEWRLPPLLRQVPPALPRLLLGQARPLRDVPLVVVFGCGGPAASLGAPAMVTGDRAV